MISNDYVQKFKDSCDNIASGRFTPAPVATRMRMTSELLTELLAYRHQESFVKPTMAKHSNNTVVA